MSLRRWAALALLGACGGPDDDGGTDAVVDTLVRGDTDPGDTQVVAAGPRPVHRLSVEEIRRSIVDVLGIDVPAADFLPDDVLDRGFDHVDPATGVTSGFVDRMAAFSVEVARRALAPTVVVHTDTPRVVYEAEHLHWDDGGSLGLYYAKDTFWWIVDDESQTSTVLEVPPGGPWRATMVVTVQPGVDAAVDARFKLDDDVVEDVFVLGTDDPSTPIPLPRTIDLGVLEEGEHTLLVRNRQPATSSIVDWYPTESFPPPAGPSIGVDVVVLEGPTVDDVEVPSPARAALVTCDPDPEDPTPCLTQILHPVLRRAWRRDPTAVEVDRIVGVAVGVLDGGGTVDEGLAQALQAVLLSPSFLFRLDVDPATVDAEGRRLHPYEVATRLAFTIWGGPPDDALLDCAAAGGLADTPDACGVRAQADRLLADPRSSALIDRFVAGWLRFPALDGYQLVPVFNPWIATPTLTSLQTEHRSLLAEFVEQDLDLRDLLVADHAFLDVPLGNLYDHRVNGWHWRRSPMPESGRSGLLTQGAVLLAAGDGTASPIKRAAWVATTLLCLDLPPPPSSVPPLGPVEGLGDLNAAVDAHLTEPVCASCHQKFDGFGRVLGTYDAVGRYRVDATGARVTADSTLPDGTRVRSAAELGEALRGNPRLGPCIAENLIVWATGEEIAHDDAWVTDVATAAEADGFGLRALVRAAVTHPRFLGVSP